MNNRALLCCGLAGIVSLALPAQPLAEPGPPATVDLRVDTGNPWRPPFGLDRVGSAPICHVTLREPPAAGTEHFLASYRGGREAERRAVDLRRNPNDGRWDKSAVEDVHYGHVELREVPDEVALFVRREPDGPTMEVARHRVSWPVIEADATAGPLSPINPVDLGAILVPHDWLLVAKGQDVRVELAALSRTGDFPDLRLKAWFDGGAPVEIALPLARGQKARRQLQLPTTSVKAGAPLHVALVAGGRELWRKSIRAMIVVDPPAVPTFGAVETKLRYDAPIAVGDRIVDHGAAWDPKLNDIVVFLPNGSRFVFWRWFRYAPLWAGSDNTAFNYEWAENLTHPFEAPGWGTLFPEPLFDAELRYGRVRIVESTPSRVHVRWTYEGTDPAYRRWGEQVAEDYYFYPDGFGTRVLTLASAPNADYELSEFIVLTPQGAHPLEVLPERMIQMLHLDGVKRDIDFPVPPGTWKRYGNTHLVLPGLREVPALYRIIQGRNDPAAAIFFSPRHVPKTAYVYQHIYKEAEIATRSLGDRGETTPGFTCLWTTIKDLPEPLSVSTHPQPDALGRSGEMMIRRWAWLIAKTDASDEILLEWAASYSAPPTLELTGARLDLPSYASERRAMRLIADSPVVEIKVKPATHCVNPVFELAGAPKEILGVTIDGQPMASDAFAWDGATLWVKARIDARGATIGLRFH